MSWVINLVSKEIPKLFYLISFKHSEPCCLTLFTTPEHIYPLVLFLKKHTFTSIDQLVDICVVDRINYRRRFELFYIFSSSK